MEILVKLLALFLAIVPHEVAHGYVAWKLGDPTARRANRLTLNPLAHIDLFGSIILPGLLIFMNIPPFGWAKPVPFNPWYFRDPRRGIMLVGAAGPIVNFTMAILIALLLRVLGPGAGLFVQFLGYLCLINIFLGVFNLIPIPPLDGSRVVMGLIPEEWAGPYMRLERFGFAIIIGLLYLGVLERVISPVAFFLFRLLLGTP
jgi:Zn-dependent protease